MCQSGSSWLQTGVVVIDDASSRANAEDIQTYAKASTFAAFLRETVGAMPAPAAAVPAAVNTAPNFLSFSSTLFLLGLSLVLHTGC